MVRVRVVVRRGSTLATRLHGRDVWRRGRSPESVGWMLVAGSDAAAVAAVEMPCSIDDCSWYRMEAQAPLRGKGCKQRVLWVVCS